MAESNAMPNAPEWVADSGVAQVQLLELYTSEGCSSCPPADAFVSRLKASPQLWQLWVPVVFHVDYWDYLGWKDPYAQPNFSRQQKRYQHQGISGSVYTPQFFINGGEWRGYFKNQALPEAKNQPGRLTLQIQQGQFTAAFTPQTQSYSQLHLTLALLGSGLRTQVTRGENAQRQLHHDFVVLQEYVLGAETGTNTRFVWRGNLKSRPELAQRAERLAWAAWVVDDVQQRVVQATGAWLTGAAD